MSYRVDTPVGVMVDWVAAGDPADANWLLCDGRAISRTTYVALFNLIGTTYGAGDASTTFNIPDVRGRGTVGPDTMGTAAGAASRMVTSAARGNSAGAETHALTTAQLASHNHAVTDPGHAHTMGGAESGYGVNSNQMFNGAARNWTSSAIDSNTTGISIQNNGSGTAHNNMPPYLVVNKILRVL